MHKKNFLALLLCLCAFTSCTNNPSSEDESLEALPPLVENSSGAESSSIYEDPSAQESSPPPEEDEPPKEEATPVVVTAEYLTATGTSVNLRSGAGTSYAALGSAEKGETYAVVGKTGGWYETYYRGKRAYISASYAAVFSLEKATDATEKVLEEGYKLLGVPYVYGAVRFHDGNGKLLAGFTAQKFDCSSLVQYIFYKGAGVKLGVHTRAQVKQGTFVKKADLQRGDCIFFTNEQRQYNTGIERVGHVAVYLGNDYILHTASDYARIEKMTTKRWNFYIEARRFL